MDFVLEIKNSLENKFEQPCFCKRLGIKNKGFKHLKILQ